MVIVNPIPGQQERNADHLLETGAAIRCNNLPAVGWKIDRLLDEPARLVMIRTQVKQLARPHAAREIVRTLFDDATRREPARGGCGRVPVAGGGRIRPSRRG